MIRKIHGKIFATTIGSRHVLPGQQHKFARSRWRPPEPWANGKPPAGGLRLRDDREPTVHHVLLAKGWSLIIPSAIDLGTSPADQAKPVKIVRPAGAASW